MNKKPQLYTDGQTISLQGEVWTVSAEEMADWFQGNVRWSYFDSEYPWTRLGYTYDWAEGSKEYGLTEFLVREGAEVTIAYTDAIPDYIKRLEQE